MLDKEGHFAGAATKLLPPYVLNFMTCLKRVLNYPNKWCRHGTQQQMIFQVEESSSGLAIYHFATLVFFTLCLLV